MAVILKVQIQKTNPEDGVFKVQLDVIDAENITMDVLVFDVEHGNFSRVASVYDLEAYPVGQSTALSEELAYFRDRGAAVTFCTPAEADEFATLTESRISLLRYTWEEIVGDYPSDVIATFES